MSAYRLNGVYRKSFAKGHDYRNAELIDPDGRVLADVRIDTLRGPGEADHAYRVLASALEHANLQAREWDDE